MNSPATLKTPHLGRPPAAVGVRNSPRGAAEGSRGFEPPAEEAELYTECRQNPEHFVSEQPQPSCGEESSDASGGLSDSSACGFRMTTSGRQRITPRADASFSSSHCCHTRRSYRKTTDLERYHQDNLARGSAHDHRVCRSTTSQPAANNTYFYDRSPERSLFIRK